MTQTGKRLSRFATGTLLLSIASCAEQAPVSPSSRFRPEGAPLKIVVNSTTTTINATADTYVRGGAANTNEGSSPILRVQASGDNRALVMFDRNAIVAAVGGGTLKSAKLLLDVKKNSDNWGRDNDRTIDVYQATKGWVEGNGRNAEVPGANQTRGTGAGATWKCAIDDDISNQRDDCTANAWEMGKPKLLLQPWKLPSVASLVIYNGLTGTLEWDVTAIVQDWIDNGNGYGLVVGKADEGASGEIDFVSIQGAGAGLKGPRLVLNYEDPTAPPTAAFGFSGTQNEGSTLTFDASASTNYLGTSAGLTYAWEFSDGTTATGKIVTKVFNDNGNYTAKLTVTDAYGSNDTSKPVAIANVDPTATFTAPASVGPGDPINLSLTGVVDPSSVDVAAGFTFAFDCGGGTYAPASAVANKSCPSSLAGSLTVRGKVIDKDGGFTEYTATVLTPVLVSTNADAFLRSGASNRNEGSNTLLRIQASGDNRPVVQFDAAAVTAARNAGRNKAMLVLTIWNNADNWVDGVNSILTVDAHPLAISFFEGDGRDIGFSGADAPRGTGNGITWNCAIDTDISNQNDDCTSTAWAGGGDKSNPATPKQNNLIPATAAGVRHFDGLLGPVQWDVSTDFVAGRNAWLIKKNNEGKSGHVDYYSKEGAAAAGNAALAPQLIMWKQ